MKNQKNFILIPKTLRIDDPDEDAKSSIWQHSESRTKTVAEEMFSRVLKQKETKTVASLLLLILVDRLMMEAAQRRRLSVIASHLRPISIPPTTADGLSSIVSPSHCNSSDSSKLETDCVFCKIIRGEAPALKLYLLSGATPRGWIIEVMNFKASTTP